MIPDLRLLVTHIYGKFRWRLAGLVILMVGNGLMEGIGIILVLPLLNAVGIGSVGEDSKVSELVQNTFNLLDLQPNLFVVLALILVVFLIQGLVFLLQSHFAAKMQSQYVALWRNDLFSTFLHSGWSFFTKSKSGELINILINETNRLSGTFYLLVQLCSATIIAVIFAVLAFVVSWQTTLALFFMVGILFIVTHGFVRKGHQIGQQLTDLGNELQTKANELIGGAKLLKSSSTETVAIEQFGTVIESMRQVNYFSSIHPNLLRAIFEFIAISFLCVLLGVSVTFFAIDTAHILIVLALFLRLFPRLSNLQQNIQLLSVYLSAIRSTTKALRTAHATAEELDDTVLPSTIKQAAVAIKVVDLHMRYGDKPILDKINLDIPAGKTIAIVGPSGSGKSTLVDCLLGLVRPGKGQILVDGISLAELPLRAWRRAVGYIAQDTFLFHADIRDNILWGAKQPSQPVEEIAKYACIHDFIMEQPKQYQTIVGDRGVRLSGGQRQRLGLARALAGHPLLLIMDEATSALDAQAEQDVLQAIKRLHGQVTIITIAHRLAAVRHADKIHVLDKGRIVESGTWDELLQQGQYFSTLWRMQNQKDPVS